MTPRKKRTLLWIGAFLVLSGLVLGGMWLSDHIEMKFHGQRPRNALNVDNPSGKTFYITIDDSVTYLVMPHAYLSQIPVYEGKHYPFPPHHVRVCDSAKTVLADEMLSINEATLLNPSRSQYVFWTLYYGKPPIGVIADTILVGNHSVIDYAYTSNALMLNMQLDMVYTAYDYKFARSISPTHSEDNPKERVLMRADDFLAWEFFNAYGTDPEENVRVLLHNEITEWHNYIAAQVNNAYSPEKKTLQTYTHWAMDATRSESFSEINAAEAVLKTRSENDSALLPLLDKIADGAKRLKEIKAGGESLAGPILSPMIEVYCCYYVVGSWPNRSYARGFSSVEQYDSAQRKMVPAALPQYPRAQQNGH